MIISESFQYGKTYWRVDGESVDALTDEQRNQMMKNIYANRYESESSNGNYFIKTWGKGEHL